MGYDLWYWIYYHILPVVLDLPTTIVGAVME